MIRLNIEIKSVNAALYDHLRDYITKVVAKNKNLEPDIEFTKFETSFSNSNTLVPFAKTITVSCTVPGHPVYEVDPEDTVFYCAGCEASHPIDE